MKQIQTPEEFKMIEKKRIELIVEKNYLVKPLLKNEELHPFRRNYINERVDKIMESIKNIHQLTTVFRASRETRKTENASE